MFLSMWQLCIVTVDTVTIMNGYRKVVICDHWAKKRFSLCFKAEKTVQSKRCIYTVSVH